MKRSNFIQRLAEERHKYYFTRPPFYRYGPKLTKLQKLRGRWRFHHFVYMKFREENKNRVQWNPPKSIGAGSGG